MTQASISHSHLQLPQPGIRSLAWCGDQLVDWLSGVRLSLDGSRLRIRDACSQAFDGAISLGEVSLVFERLGTEARLLHQGRTVRGLSRDVYRAEVHEYPACLWRTPAGRTLLAHCPEHYNQIEIEDVTTGRRVTEARTREPEDVFHSRLQTNPSATHLLSAGWVWQPWDVVGVVELARALEEPETLDHFEFCANQWGDEAGSAAWQSDRCLLVGVTHDGDPVDATEGEARVRNGILVYDVCAKRIVRQVALQHVPGTLMPIGHDKVLTLFEHPRLISLTSGEELYAWPELPSGQQGSSILWHRPLPPPIALDPARRRFAIAHGDEVHVITLEDA